MSTNNSRVKDLIENMKSLNKVSSQLSRDISNKNKIIESGLKDCDNCKKNIEQKKHSKK